MIYDICTFNGEYDLFELRYQILKDYVDEFRVIEFDKTFSGKDKPRYIEESDNYFYDKISTWDKVKCYYMAEKDYEKYKEMAKSSPNTKGAEHWKREFMQKESIKDCLTDLQDDDIVFIGDCDEIWNPDFKIPQIAYSGYKSDKLFLNDLGVEYRCPVWKLKLRVYTYYLNNCSSEEFWGTIATEYQNIKNSCLNHLRSNMKHYTTKGYDGWHFTSLKDNLAKKLEDSYTKETYANDWVMQNLQNNIESNRDFLGRDFTYTVDESEWPQYLKDNREKYKHLLK